MTTAKNAFLKHIEECSRIVATWPKWKQDACKAAIHIEPESEDHYQQRKAAQRVYDYWPGD